MTLIIELLIGASIISLASGIENISLQCTAQWIWAGAPSGSFPSGCQKATTPSGNINTGSGLKSISGTGPGAGGGPGGGSVIHPYGG